MGSIQATAAPPPPTAARGRRGGCRPPDSVAVATRYMGARRCSGGGGHPAATMPTGRVVVGGVAAGHRATRSATAVARHATAVAATLRGMRGRRHCLAGHHRRPLADGSRRPSRGQTPPPAGRLTGRRPPARRCGHTRHDGRTWRGGGGSPTPPTWTRRWWTAARRVGAVAWPPPHIRSVRRRRRRCWRHRSRRRRSSLRPRDRRPW